MFICLPHEIHKISLFHFESGTSGEDFGTAQERVKDIRWESDAYGEYQEDDRVKVIVDEISQILDEFDLDILVRVCREILGGAQRDRQLVERLMIRG